MNARARAAALLPVWVLVGTAGLASTVTFTAVEGSRAGCVEGAVANLVAVGGMAGLGLALSALLLVAVVRRYRTVAALIGALAALGLSLYAVVTFLARDGAACGL